MKNISIKILGYPIETEIENGEEDLVNSIAEFVEGKLLDIQRDTGIVDTQKLAILATFHIADELLRLKNSKENVSGIPDTRTKELIGVLDQAISA
jgi:cell division protein ZapA (FtsZ GTPase activity inhibitor)